MEVIIKNVTVNGRKYKLQHPGARAWMTLKMSMFKPSTDEIEMVPLLDYFFENCCFPEDGQKLSFDSFDESEEKLQELSEVWGGLALRFLAGKLPDGTVYEGNQDKSKKR
jgi:hypothetical protein